MHLGNSKYLIKLAEHCSRLGFFKEEDEILSHLVSNVRKAQDVNVPEKQVVQQEIQQDKVELDVIKELERSIKNAVKRLDIKLLSVNADPKTYKGFKSGKGFLTGVLYLAPHTLSGKNVCPCASAGCIEACLHTAGNPAFQKTKDKSRINKTQWFFGKPNTLTYSDGEQSTRVGFLQRLKREILALKKIANDHGLELAIRLNGTSDIGWHNILREFMQENSEIKFYDYTKIHTTAFNSAGKSDFPVHYTFSRSESNQHHVMTVLEKGGNVAVVFDKVPLTWHGYKVINGDTHDLRFLDNEEKEYDESGKPKGLIIGLKAKGDAIRQYRNDKSLGAGPEDGFVVRATELPNFPHC